MMKWIGTRLYESLLVPAATCEDELRRRRVARFLLVLSGVGIFSSIVIFFFLDPNNLSVVLITTIISLTILSGMCLWIVTKLQQGTERYLRSRGHSLPELSVFNPVGNIRHYLTLRKVLRDQRAEKDHKE